MTSKADVANKAIKCFLERIGRQYDEIRGKRPFGLDPSHKKEVLQHFENRCCYCNKKLTVKKTNKDHLVPMNKDSMGLNSWGNVVPSCSACNSMKGNKHWKEFLKDICTTNEFTTRKKKINSFVRLHNYDTSKLELKEITNDLYKDVGSASDALVKKRLEQAERRIRKLT